jgi:hypothetical protein
LPPKRIRFVQQDQGRRRHKGTFGDVDGVATRHLDGTDVDDFPADLMEANIRGRGTPGQPAHRPRA